MIKIIHTNDIHGRVEEDVESGIGFSRVISKAREIKAEHGTLLLDAGDTVHGLPIVGVSRGKAMIDIMNEVGYDAMVPGNHDFNYGRERLVELAGYADFPVIAANIYDERGTRIFRPYTVKVVDRFKVGIFGLTTPEASFKTKPENIAGLEFRSPVEEARRVVEELREEEKVDVVIALVHLGLDESTSAGDRSDGLAEAVGGIDVILDGHSHTELRCGKLSGDTLIAQTGGYMNSLGMVSLTVEGSGRVSSRAELIDRNGFEGLEEDLGIKELISRIERENLDSTAEVIGRSDIDLDGNRESVRSRETNLGNLLADAMKHVTGADLAITNGGGIRESIGAGFITRKEVISAFPFGNFVITKKVRGTDILAAMEHGLSHYPEPSSGFPHVGGISFSFDISDTPGSRVRNVMVGDEKLNPDKIYKLATNDFLASGGDSYHMFKDSPLLNEYQSIDEVLAVYIQRRFEVGFENEEPRIKVVDGYRIAKAI